MHKCVPTDKICTTNNQYVKGIQELKKVYLMDSKMDIAMLAFKVQWPIQWVSVFVMWQSISHLIDIPILQERQLFIVSLQCL